MSAFASVADDIEALLRSFGERHPGHPDQKVHGRKKKLPGLPDAPEVVKPTKAAPKSTKAASKTPTVSGSLAERRSALEALGKRRPKKTRKLSGGQIAATKMREYSNGAKVVDKSYGTALIDSKDAAEQADAEVLGSLVLDAVTGRAPAVARNGDDRVLMEYVPGQTGAQLYPVGIIFGDAAAIERRLELESSEAGKRLGLADVIMANADRNDGNWIVDEGGALVGIDHGSAFETRRLEPVNIFDVDITKFKPNYISDVVGGSSPFASHLTEMVGDEYVLRDSIDVSAAELDGIGERLAGLRSDFEKSGRTEWHEAMMARLADLRSRAAMP